MKNAAGKQPGGMSLKSKADNLATQRKESHLQLRKTKLVDLACLPAATLPNIMASQQQQQQQQQPSSSPSLALTAWQQTVLISMHVNLLAPYLSQQQPWHSSNAPTSIAVGRRAGQNCLPPTFLAFMSKNVWPLIPAAAWWDRGGDLPRRHLP